MCFSVHYDTRIELSISHFIRVFSRWNIDGMTEYPKLRFPVTSHTLQSLPIPFHHFIEDKNPQKGFNPGQITF